MRTLAVIYAGKSRGQTPDCVLIFVFSHDFNVVFGTDITLPMTKAERLLYHETMLTHAMVFTGVSLDVSCQQVLQSCN